MDRTEYPPMIQRLLESIDKQGAEFIRMNYDPEGGTLNQGRLFIAARKDGRVFTMSGSLSKIVMRAHTGEPGTRCGFVNDEWLMMLTDNYSDEQWAGMQRGNDIAEGTHE